MSKLERHISEITEDESSGIVDLRYSSPSRVHFAALQMLGGVYGKIDLLVLEHTEVSNGYNEYYRVGVVTLHYISLSDVTSTELLSIFAEFEDSETARLDPRKQQPRKQEALNAVIAELEREPWNIETIVII